VCSVKLIYIDSVKKERYIPHFISLVFKNSSKYKQLFEITLSEKCNQSASIIH